MPVLEFKNVSFDDKNERILKNISFTIDKGDFLSIVGPSGSGKSTMLKLCCHLISPSEGDIFLNQRSFFQYDPTDIRRKISYCFQIPVLFENTVKDNLEYPFTLRGETINMILAEELLHRLNLTADIMNKEVKNLSGGEKQRIALVRSLLTDPEILLLDEVTSALDHENIRLVNSLIKELNNRGLTVLWITHGLDKNRDMANKILSLEKGELKSLEVVK